MSEVSTIARPYAKAAFDAAKSQQALSAWDTVLTQLSEIISLEKVKTMLGLPMYTNAVKTEMLSEMIKAEKPEGFDNFLKLLGEHNRLNVIDSIYEQYAELMRNENDEIIADITTALPIDDERQDKLKAALGSRFGKSVSLNIEIDESLVGGAIIRAGDLVIDGSVAGHVEQLKRQLH